MYIYIYIYIYIYAQAATQYSTQKTWYTAYAHTQYKPINIHVHTPI